MNYRMTGLNIVHYTTQHYTIYIDITRTKEHREDRCAVCHMSLLDLTVAAGRGRINFGWTEDFVTAPEWPDAEL